MVVLLWEDSYHLQVNIEPIDLDLIGVPNTDILWVIS